LVEQERAELEIIMEYLPKQLTNDEIAALVNQVVQEVGAEGPSDMKKVMPKLMPHVRGKADGQEVSKMVMEVLRGLAD